MTIAFETATGIAGGTVNTGASKNEPYVGVVAGRMSILVACARPDTATISTPSGWTLIGDQVGGVAATEPANGTGHLYAWYRQLDGSETGSVAVAGTGVNTLEASMTVYSTTATWSTPALVGGSQSSHVGNRSVTCGAWAATLGAGDYVQLAFGSDRAVLSAASLAISQSGATFGTITSRNAQASVFANDVGIYTADGPVTVGTANAPTISFTSATANCGPGIVIRLREAGATTNAPAGNALAAGAANNPGGGIASSAGNALSSGAALNASPLIGAAAVHATAAVAALTPSPSVSVSAECATGTGAAYDAVFGIPSSPAGPRIVSTTPQGRITATTPTRITTTSPRGWL